MKPGDLVMFHKSDIWKPPHDIKNGTTGVVIKKHEYRSIVSGNHDYETLNHDYEVLMEGKIRLIDSSLLRVINEAR
jgi:hypothetical protein